MASQTTIDWAVELLHGQRTAMKFAWSQGLASLFIRVMADARDKHVEQAVNQLLDVDALPTHNDLRRAIERCSGAKSHDAERYAEPTDACDPVLGMRLAREAFHKAAPRYRAEQAAARVAMGLEPTTKPDDEYLFPLPAIIAGDARAATEPRRTPPPIHYYADNEDPFA